MVWQRTGLGFFFFFFLPPFFPCSASASGSAFSSGLYLSAILLAWKSPVLLQEEISRYSPVEGSHASRS